MGLYAFYRDQSNGMPGLPLILLHGAGGTHLHWPPEARRLAGWRVYAPDLPGHGQSSGPGCVTIGEYARAVTAWMDATGIERAVVAGHSMGGAVALELALEYPQRVGGLGLVASGARLQVAPQLLELAANPAGALAAVSQVIDWSFSASASVRLKELALARMAATPPETLRGDFLACNAFDCSERLGEIRAPTLVLVGEADRMTPLRLSSFLAQQIPAATLQVMPDAGHMLMLEQPKAATGALRDFLAGHQF